MTKSAISSFLRLLRTLVADVRLGLGYTAVQLDDGRCGLAYTFRHELHEGCGVMSEAGTLAGRRASDLAQWAKSTDLLVSAVGLATLNALIEVACNRAGRRPSG